MQPPQDVLPPNRPDGAPSPPRVMVVDDDPVNLQLIGCIFAGDHDVRLHASILEALASCEADPPDLILLDVLMPEMDGLEACRRLKATPATRDIPVIFITGQSSPTDETQGLEAGAVDFITKPINASIVRMRVKTHLTLKAQADQLRQMAYVDGLTGVANRRRFEESLDTEWRRCRRSGTPLSLVLGDIDTFKHYNDLYGHLQGDACLKAVAQALKGTLKRPQDLVARYGGEEFVCILPETDIAGAQVLATNLLNSVRCLALPHAGTPSGIVTLSLGLATAIPSAEMDPAALVAAADERLYVAKERGRNRVEG